MKFWIIVLLPVLALAAWGWWTDRRRLNRGGRVPGDAEDAIRRSQGHDHARGAAGDGGGGF